MEEEKRKISKRERGWRGEMGGTELLIYVIIIVMIIIVIVF